MTTPKIVHDSVPPPMPRLDGYAVAPLASLLAGLAGLLAIAAPSM